MPIYEYDCYDCGLRTETIMSVSESHNGFICLDCGSKNTKRSVSIPSISIPFDGTFKGSGKSDLDKIIGTSSEKRHQEYKVEREKRDQVRKETGIQALGKTSDGRYIPVSDSHIQNRKTAYEKFEYAKKTGLKVER